MTTRDIEMNSVKLKDLHSDSLRYVGLFVRECTDIHATYTGCTSILHGVQSPRGLYERLQEAIDRMCHAIEFSASIHGIAVKTDTTEEKAADLKDSPVDSDDSLLERIENIEVKMLHMAALYNNNLSMIHNSQSKIEEIRQNLEIDKECRGDDIRYIVESKNLILYKEQQIEKKLEEIEQLDARLNILERWFNIK